MAHKQTVLLPIALFASIVAVSSKQEAARPIAIVDATVIPMTSNATILTNHTVIVRDDRISALAPSAKTPVPADALRIDGRGKFVMPGLADMHVHLEYFEQPDILGLCVANGVTTIRNMDGRPYILDWKKKAAAGQPTNPRIYSAGPLLDGNPPVRLDNTVVSSAAEAWNVPTLIQPLRELLRPDEIKNRLASDEVHYIPASGRKQGQEMATRMVSRMDDEDWALVADASRNRAQVVKAIHRAGRDRGRHRHSQPLRRPGVFAARRTGSSGGGGPIAGGGDRGEHA